MDSAFLLGNAVPLATYIASLALLVIALGKKWPVETTPLEHLDGPKEETFPSERSPFKKRIKSFVIQYRWELTLGAAVCAILLFAVMFAPPRLNGAIATQPGSPGRPFYNLRWIRTFLSTYYDTIWVWSSVLSSLICLGLLAWASLKRSGLGAQIVMLCASLNVAGVGQWLLHEEGHQDAGKFLYYVGIYGLVIWALVARNRLAKDLERKPVGRRMEVLLVLGLLLLASFSRLYALRAIPYGIEGDEAKWTSEAINLGIRGVPDSLGEYHRDALPVSYYLQIPLHRLLGPSLFAARLTVVILSIIATLLFYWLLRQITGIPVAALASYLLSISIFDISASRLANVESFVKLWPVLGLALLALAVQARRWQIYGLSGLAMALGMLTYDTVWPVFGVALLVAIIELARQKESRHASASSIAALIAPPLLTLPVIIPYMASRLPYYKFENTDMYQESGSTISQNFGNVIDSWFVSTRGDFLYNRPGPLLNAFLLPFLLLGLIIAFSLIKKRISYWTLLWAGLVIFPIPVLNNSPVGRLYYPALPAVYVLVALGIFIFWKEMDRFFGANFRPIWIAVTLVPLVWLPFANLFIYFNEVFDAEDRLMRREIGELAAQAAEEGTLILLPATPGIDTPLNNEYQMLELYMMQKLPPGEINTAYTYVAPEDDLLTRIEVEAPNYQKIEVIFDKKETGALAETLQVCYPQGRLIEGTYFSRFSLDHSASSGIQCSFATLEIDLRDGDNLSWELSEGTAQELEMLCEVRQTNFKWLEPEDFLMINGWQTEIEFAPGWSGTGFAMDNYGSGPLFLKVYTEEPQNHYVWVRYYKRVVDQNSAYLSINNNLYPFANVQENGLNSWRWERIGPVNLDALSEISISRIYQDDPLHFMAIFVDSLVVTTDPGFLPDKDLWKSMPSKTFLLEQPQSSGTVPLDLPPDSYRCKVLVESERTVVDVSGSIASYLTSNTIEFDVR